MPRPRRAGAVALPSLRVAAPPGGVGGRRAAGRSLPWGRPEPEAHAVAQASLLLQRYGIVARELALLDPWLLPWRVLYEVLSRMELAGEVRRGYFVEGLSGAQFALPEAARLLQDLALPSTAAAPVVLLHSLDPANLYGAGAPFDMPLLDGGTRPLLRRAGQLAGAAGRPAGAAGRAAGQEADRAGQRQPRGRGGGGRPACRHLRRGRGPTRHKLTVEEWNGQPVTATRGPRAAGGGGVRPRLPGHDAVRGVEVTFWCVPRRRDMMPACPIHPAFLTRRRTMPRRLAFCLALSAGLLAAPAVRAADPPKPSPTA